MGKRLNIISVTRKINRLCTVLAVALNAQQQLISSKICLLNTKQFIMLYSLPKEIPYTFIVLLNKKFQAIIFINGLGFFFYCIMLKSERKSMEMHICKGRTY